MKSSAERATTLEHLDSDATELVAAATVATDRHTQRAPVAGWTERQVLAHLVAVEVEVFQARFQQLAEETEPHWSWVEPGGAPGHASLRHLGERLIRERAATVRHVSALDDDGWAREGIHATFGRLDVAGLCRVALDHDREHLEDLRRRA